MLKYMTIYVHEEISRDSRRVRRRRDEKSEKLESRRGLRESLVYRSNRSRPHRSIHRGLPASRKERAEEKEREGGGPARALVVSQLSHLPIGPSHVLICLLVNSPPLCFLSLASFCFLTHSFSLFLPSQKSHGSREECPVCFFFAYPSFAMAKSDRRIG